MRRGRRSSFVGAPPARSPAGELSKSPDGSAAAVKRKAWEWEAQSVSRTRSLSQQQTDMSEDEEEQEFTEWLNDQLRAGYETYLQTDNQGVFRQIHKQVATAVFEHAYTTSVPMC